MKISWHMGDWAAREWKALNEHPWLGISATNNTKTCKNKEQIHNIFSRVELHMELKNN